MLESSPVSLVSASSSRFHDDEQLSLHFLGFLSHEPHDLCPLSIFQLACWSIFDEIEDVF